jgi:nitroreductase
MRFLDLVKKRQSCRKFAPKRVAREKIERCLEAARLAPSASNAQPWYFIVADEPRLKESLAKSTFGSLIRFNKFTLEAPVMVVVVSEPQKLITYLGSQLKRLPYHLIDIGMAAEHFCLQAEEEGLGSCLIGWFNERKIKSILKLSGAKKVELLIVLGYPARGYGLREKVRKKLDQMRQYNI